MTVQPGPIVLLGSGETSPGAQKIYHHIFSHLHEPVRVAILETPAGFEPNSDYVAGQVGEYIEKRLQNFRPQVQIVPARRRGTAFSPDDPARAAELYDANVLVMGPGSPTYTVRQLRDSLVWQTVVASHQMGMALIFASAATLAMSRLTMPVYEIYKVGEDLHWKPGLDFFGAYGLPIIFVSHWNNQDGGAVLDTSRCYLGQARFEALLERLPGGVSDYTVVGIDEKTALIIDPGAGACRVMGAGGVTFLRSGETHRFEHGARFPLPLLGDFHLPPAGAIVPAPVWDATARGRAEAAALRAAVPEPAPAVLALLDERQAARARKDWQDADRLRNLIAEHGWRVLDTPAGQVLEMEGGGEGRGARGELAGRRA